MGVKQSGRLFQPEPRNPKAKLFSQVIIRTKHIHSNDFDAISDGSIIFKKVISDDSLCSSFKDSEDIEFFKVLSNEAHLSLSEGILVPGQVDGEFIAPMIYKEIMTSDFFVEWFKTQLLPALKTPHVIVMDNASFHPKKILDELCVKDKHFFLPLPPYSPDLNPIEQAWAVLKKKVTDLLREVPNIFECLECFFKTK